MPRRFVAAFLLPLVRGGTLQVGRPLSLRDLELMRSRPERRGRADAEAALELGLARHQSLLSLVSAAPVPQLDEETWRLGGAVHDLLALAHPQIATGPGATSRIQRIATEASTLARLGAPPSLTTALTRHSLLARLPEIVRDDHTVRFWLGRRTFVGRRPPARILALPRLRAVTVESVRRAWLRDVGVLAVARPAFVALTESSPLGEALDPLRLDPPWSWGRVLAILKFPSLCRLVAGRLLTIGLGPSGDALTEALYRFISPLRDDSEPVPATAPSVAFALGFLAHLVWLDHLFAHASRGPAPVTAPAIAAATTSDARIGRSAGLEAGADLAVLLAAADDVEPDLIWPPDVPRESALGRGFARRLQAMFDRADARNSHRWPLAREVANLAAVSARRLLLERADKV